jgi:hypothetical protein
MDWGDEGVLPGTVPCCVGPNWETIPPAPYSGASDMDMGLSWGAGCHALQAGMHILVEKAMLTLSLCLGCSGRLEDRMHF